MHTYAYISLRAGPATADPPGRKLRTRGGTHEASATANARKRRPGIEARPVTRPIPLWAAVTLPGQLRYVARARDLVTIALGDQHPCAEPLTIIVTELVTNSVVHSRSRLDGGKVTITLRSFPGDGLSAPSIRVEVTDDGADGLPVLRALDSGTVTGWGLHLVDALATAWNCGRDPAGTTTTWADVTA